jgi:two-component system sensor histidine kinase KdpD
MSVNTGAREAPDILLAPGDRPGPEKALTSGSDSGANRKWLAVELGAAASVFVAMTLAAFSLHLTFSATAFVYYLIIVLAALRWGFWEASAFSIAAVGCLDYFFTAPLFSLRVNRPSDWTALVAFEFAGLVVSRLSAQAQHHARVAERERSNIEKLYKLARRILLLDPQDPAGAQIARFIQSAIQVEAVALFDFPKAQVYSAGAEAPDLAEIARQTWIEEQDHNDTVAHVWSRVLRLGHKGTGAVALRAKYLNPLVVDAVASIAAVALERSRSLEKETRAEAARQSEQLRAAVLDALAHAFKTPLTVIRAVSSGLLEAGSLNPEETELVTLIDNESVRLNDLATRLLQTARLEGTAPPVRREQCDIAKVIHEVLAGFSAQLADRPLKIVLPDGGVPVSADAELVATALCQLVDNAVKYSWPGTAITISITLGQNEAVVSVHNLGPAISPADRERIFDRFYRSPGTEHRAPGTGLGLSITRKVAEAHLGRTWVVSNENSGTTFFFALPMSRAERNA